MNKTIKLQVVYDQPALSNELLNFNPVIHN